jgi:hypothetical protein
VPHQIHEIRGVFPVMNGERRRKADVLSMFAQQARPDRVKSAGPRQ